ncbi:MAG TPA: phosphatidylglycerol lysyltransferase domain-containing protein [Acidimicrobiales bacterium]
MELRERIAASTVVDVPRGAHALVVSDLLLPAELTDASASACAALATELESWQGPGVFVIAGNLVDPTATTDVARLAATALDAHDRLRDAVAAFCAGPARRGFLLPGWRDAELAEVPGRQRLAQIGLEVAHSLELRLETASGERRVVVETARPTFVPKHPSTSEWMVGEEQLEDPGAAHRFLSSRLRYRGLRRLLWLAPLIAVLAVVVTRFGIVDSPLFRLTHRVRVAHHFVQRVVSMPWTTRLLITLGVIVAAEIIVAATAATLSARRYPRELRDQPRVTDPLEGLLTDSGPVLDRARDLLDHGATGYVVGGSKRAALGPLLGGFCASPGATSEVVRELPGRFGLPSVFLARRKAGFLELEAGTDAHARLILGDATLPGATVLERIASRDRRRGRIAPLRVSLVASWPSGQAWPADPDAIDRQRRQRLVRRVAAGLLILSGLANVAVAVAPPLRSRLHAVLGVLPIGVSQTAAALLALAGVALIMLARGVRRGQRRAWTAAVLVLAFSVAAHVGRNGAIAGTIASLAVLAFLLVQRADFRGQSDRGSLSSAAPFLVLTCAVAVGGAVAGIEATNAHAGMLPGFSFVVLACVERLFGATTVALPDHLDDFVYPAMLAVGISVAATTIYLATRPVVDRRLSERHTSAERRAAELRARDLVRRHGLGTLDYFALRDDKQWFFHRDTLVAYAVYGGVCLVSPDPIGPEDEREEAWGAFSSFASAKGWTIGVLGAGEAWLPLYASAGMRYLYLGDEAVVDVKGFSLQGGRMKGLRQACTRMERHGYTVEFLDPATIDPARVAGLVELMALNRRGENERGFSMVLGRLFDPKDNGLLLTVVSGPDGSPAAMCQFVPTPPARGYSLDLMRRDPGEHPNGLLDFTLCATIEHLASRGATTLSLNFAAFRSILDGERGEGMTTRAERWALKRLSGIMPIETLWRFNAKYFPEWLPRYLVYPAAESFLPVVMSTLRAESITELPVIGRFLTNDPSNRPGTVVPESLLASPHADHSPMHGP